MFSSKSSVTLIVVLFVYHSQAAQFLLSNKYEGMIWIDGLFQTTNNGQLSYNYNMGKGKQMIINTEQSTDGRIKIKTWCTAHNKYCKYCGITEYCDLTSKQASPLADITLTSGNHHDRISVTNNLSITIIPMGDQGRSKICIPKPADKCPTIFRLEVSKGTELKCTSACAIINSAFCCTTKHNKYPEFVANEDLIYYKYHTAALTPAYLITINNT